MRTKQPQEQPKEVAIVEQTLAELLDVEAKRETLESEVERARAQKLKEVSPELAPVDKKEKKLKSEAINFVKANRQNKAIFPKGKKSIHTRAGTVGFRSGKARVILPRKLAEADLIAFCKQFGIAPLCVDVIERFNKTKFRRALADGAISPSIQKKLGIRIQRREHYYARTKTAKRARPSSAKATSKKGRK